MTVTSRLEPFRGHYRIRPVVTDQCLSPRDRDTSAGAEVVRRACAGDPDQEFDIELVPPP